MEYSDKLERGATKRMEEAEAKLAQMRSVLADMDERVRSVVVDHPVLTLIGAISMGYVVGRLIARR
jgi:hypothetical protein